MGELVLAALVPHPPIMVEEVGKGEVKKVQASRQSMANLASALEEADPETVVMITPHGAVFTDVISIPGAETLEGSLKRFGAPQVRGRYAGDPEFAGILLETCSQQEVPVVKLEEGLMRRFGTPTELDHGLMVPLSFFRGLKKEFALLPVNMGILPRPKLYAFGKALQQAILQSGRRVAVFASADLSHRVTPDAPAGYHPRGKEFDLKLKELLEKADVQGIMELPEDLVEDAGQCGYRPLLMLLGVFDGFEIDCQVLSYEAPFGVGYLVARFRGKGSSEQKAQDYRYSPDQEENNPTGQAESALVRLARQSLEHYLTTGKMLQTEETTFEDLPLRAGTFVTLKKHGQLRGCIGTIEPTQPTLAGEIISNAVQAGVGDPRFSPVTAEELEELTISVDVLGVPEP
ncbi:MAG TPA: AmmeMemoRadiSam system protein B, partial [Clostridia bacterium]|nr:AmmeMemoRadiSam system protein B [Clostridia bacterium]